MAIKEVEKELDPARMEAGRVARRLKRGKSGWISASGGKYDAPVQPGELLEVWKAVADKNLVWGEEVAHYRYVKTRKKNGEATEWFKRFLEEVWKPSLASLGERFNLKDLRVDKKGVDFALSGEQIEKIEDGLPKTFDHLREKLR